MTLTRLIVAAFVVCSISVFAQRLPGNALSGPCWSRASTPSEPWRIIPNPLGDVSSGQDPLSHIRMDRSGQPGSNCVYYFMRDGHPASVTGRFHEEVWSDSTCYSIRSYVVARDSKDSDSTHPAGYSTCQPTDRYRLKSTEIRVESPDR